MIIIFEDERLGEEVWKDTTVVFREFSAREKRKKAERNYVRKYSRVLNGMLEGIEEETMDFRFGRIERSAGHDSSIGALCSSRDEDMEDMKWLRHFSRNHGPSWRVANFGVGSL